MTYKYDQNDNLIYNGSQVFKHDGLDSAVNIGWYQYDELNRATISHASVDTAGTGLALGSGGQKISYDTAGRRIGIETTADKTDFKYDASGHLSEIRVNDLVKSKRTVAKDGTILSSTEWGDYKTREKRIIGFKSFGSPIYEYYDLYHTKKIRDESYGYSQYGEKTTINDLIKVNDRTNITFDANGNQLQRSVTNDGKTNTSTYAYEKWNSYKQQSTTQPFDSGHKKIQDTIGLQHYQYDANGNVKDLRDATGRKRQNFFYFDGRTIGEAGDFTSANKDFVRMNSEATEGYTKAEKIKNSTTQMNGQGAQKDQQSANFTFGYGGVNPYTSSVGYTTNTDGETAKTIAQSVYGDSSLWHVIAEANGISGTDALPKGTSIRVPEAVYSVKSTAQNLGVTQGDTLGNAQPLVPDSPRMNTGAWDEDIQLAITIVIEVVAVVAAVAVGVLTFWTGPGAAFAAAGTYATVKQLGNNAAGRQDGWNWGQFAYDAVSYYATAGTGGAATGAKQIAIQAAKTATTKALVDHGFSKATGGKYGREFTWENYLTSFATSAATTAISSKFEASKGADAFEIAGKRLGNQVANGLVSDAIRRNTYGSYDADKETGLNFLERTLQSTSTSLANDLGNAVAKSTLQSYYGDDDVGQARFDYIKEQEKLNAQQPDWIDSTLDFLGIADLPAQTQQPKNVLAAEQQANEKLREKTDLIDPRNAQAAIGDGPGSMSDVAVLGRQGVFGGEGKERGLNTQHANPQDSVLEQEGFAQAQYLEDAVESGDVLVLGFNETEAVINTEALFEGDITSKEYDYDDFADYEKINEETVESDLFDLDVANGFADSNEVNPFTQLYGDIRDELTEYGNYASVSFDEAVDAVDDGLSSAVEGVSSFVEDAKKPFEIILHEVFKDIGEPKQGSYSNSTSIENTSLVQLEASELNPKNSNIDPRIVDKAIEGQFGQFADFTGIKTKEEFDAKLIEAKEKQAVFKEIERTLKSASSEVEELKTMLALNKVSFSSADSTEQLSHFRDQMNFDLTDHAGINNTLNPGAFNSVELGANGAFFGEGDTAFGGVGLEYSIALDKTGKGSVNLGVFGALGKAASIPTYGDSKSSKEVSFGLTLIGSPTANYKELGSGGSITEITTGALDIGKGKGLMRGGSLDIIAGKTVNPDSLLPDHSFIGIGGNAVIWNDDKFLAPSIAQSVEAEFAWEVGTLDWQEDTTKSVFNVLSGTLQAAFVGLNYASNIGAHPIGGINKPFNVHKNSPISNLNSEFKLNQSLSERGTSFNKWLNERYKFERRE